MLDHFETVFYTLAFVVPGFVFDVALYAGARAPMRETHLSVVRFLTLSCLNYAPWAWLVFFLLQPTFLSGYVHRMAMMAACWALIIFVSPTIGGLVLARLSRTGKMRRLLSWLGLKPLHQIPTAWDYVFHDLRRIVWAYVTLKDGSTVAGLISGRSFASSDPGERDLFLERVYRAEPGTPWMPVDGSAGILICADEIRHIEMWENAGDKS